MKILLLGATGKVGSRLISAFLTRKHEVVAYVCDPSKLTTTSNLVIQGSATDVAAIRKAAIDYECDAVVNVACYAGMWKPTTEFLAIVAAVTKAAIEAGK
jgi:putative NADH-flavin reductase